MSESEDDPEPPRASDGAEVAAPEVLPEVPAAEEESAAEIYRKRARLAEDRLAEVLAAYRESRQETEAYRERLTRQLQKKYEQRHEELLLKFIDILDNFDRALEASQTAGFALVEGLILVRTQLLQMLQEQGLERIPVLGLPFDPHVSEAVLMVPVEDSDQQGVVVQEMLRGYRIKGKVVRASRVGIGAYSGAPAAAVPEPMIGEAAPAAIAAATLHPVEDGPTPPAGLSMEQVEQVVAEAVEAVEAVEAAAAVEEIDTTDDAEAALEVAAESADAAEPEVIEVDAEAPPPAPEADALSLDEIIARAEAREVVAHTEPPPDSIMYDDLTELADVDEDVAGDAEVSEEASEDGDERDT